MCKVVLSDRLQKFVDAEKVSKPKKAKAKKNKKGKKAKKVNVDRNDTRLWD